MKRTIKLVMIALAAIGLGACSKPATNAEIAQAYNFYIEAPRTLSKVISKSQSDTLITETVASDDESYVRKTEINQADKTSKITVTFKDFNPGTEGSVKINGEIVLSSLSNLFAINGTLNFKGMKPSRLEFRNVTLTQHQTDGNPTFLPEDGTILADKREISVDEFFVEIMK